MICRRPPPPGPVLPSWPPSLATGLCSWQAEPGSLLPQDASALLTYAWEPGARRYYAATHIGNVTLVANWQFIPGLNLWLPSTTYYYRGTLIDGGSAPMQPLPTSGSINRTLTVAIPGPNAATTVFSLYATPLL